MKTSTLICLILSVCLLIQGCQKEKENEELKPENVLCDGKTGTNSYLPLSKGNKWVYDVYSDQTGDYKMTFEITGYEKLGDYTYFKMERTGGTPHTRYFRYTSEGIIVEFINFDDYLFLPSDFSSIQTFPVGPTLVANFIPRTVSNVSAYCDTKHCNYTGCVKIDYEGGIVFGEMYVKKGLGIVYEKYNIGGMDWYFKLASVIIQ